MKKIKKILFGRNGGFGLGVWKKKKWYRTG